MEETTLENFFTSFNKFPGSPLNSKYLHYPNRYKEIFLLCASLIVPIFNEKSHRTRAEETSKVYPNYESFHSSCPMRSFVENWRSKSLGHKKT